MANRPLRVTVVRRVRTLAFGRNALGLDGPAAYGRLRPGRRLKPTRHRAGVMSGRDTWSIGGEAVDAATEYEALVLQLEQVEGAEQTILALRAAGEDAKPALLEGMRHPSYRVRRGCLLVLDHSIIDDATRLVVLHALEDPHRKVRTAALHVLACEVCKPDGYCGIEGVDLDAIHLEHARHDRS